MPTFSTQNPIPELSGGLALTGMPSFSGLNPVPGLSDGLNFMAFTEPCGQNPTPVLNFPVSISYSSGKTLQNRSCCRRPVLTVRAGESVNEGIHRDLCSMHYVSVDPAVRHIVQLRQGALMAKIDIQQAYRNIPVHLKNWCGMVNPLHL